MIRQLSVDRSLVLVVDMQASLLPVIDRQYSRIASVSRLIEVAHKLSVPVFATEHVPQKLGHTLPSLKISHDRVLSKSHFDATREDLFVGFLPEDRPQVVLVGAEAHVCVMQTALGLLQSSREVWLATDGCGSRHDQDRQLAFARLARAGAELVSGEMVGFEWLAHANHPEFRAVLATIKSRG